MEINCIIPELLYLASLKEASDLQLLRDTGITDILTVGPDMPPLFPEKFRYLICPVDDDLHSNIYKELFSCILFIEETKEAKGKVLVHCEAGMSRSATVCIAYLMFTNKMKYEAAIEYVKERRPIVSPNECFIKQLQLFEQTEHSFDTEDPVLCDMLHAIERTRLHKPSVVDQEVFIDPKIAQVKTETAFDAVIPQLVELLASQDEVVISGQDSSASLADDRFIISETNLSDGTSQSGTEPETNNKEDYFSGNRASVSDTEEKQSTVIGKGEEIRKITATVDDDFHRQKQRSSSASTSKKLNLFNDDFASKNKLLSNSTEDSIGTIDSKNQQENIEDCPKKNAAAVITKVLLGHVPTNSDEKKLTSYLSKSEESAVATQAFTGIRQALRMMRKAVSIESEETVSHVQGLKRSLKHVSEKLEKYTGFPIDSPEFARLLKTPDALQRILSKIELEYNSALAAVKSVHHSDYPSNEDEEISTSRQSARKAFNRSATLPDDSQSVECDLETPSDLKKKRRRKSATIEMLLLFAKLGLRRSIREQLTPKAYRQLSQMLEGGLREKAALESIDQGSLIELLRYLEYNSPTKNEHALKRLLHVCEARLILMVEAKTAISICDALLVLPKIRGSIRRVATYSLHFMGAVIGTRMALRSQRKDEIKATRSFSTSAFDSSLKSKKLLHPAISGPGDSTPALMGWTKNSILEGFQETFKRGTDLVNKLWNPQNARFYKESRKKSINEGFIASISQREGGRRRAFFRSSKLRGSFRGKIDEIQNNFDPTMALQGLLKHVSTVSGPRLFSSDESYIKKIEQLKEDAKNLKKFHPLICVADNEKRNGLSLLPKASTVLRENIKDAYHGGNQTPYVFDFQLRVLAFFKPCDHDTTLQLPNDTSAKFREILKRIFELLPEVIGGEVALTEITETATLSQHASAGFALSTVLQYLDRTFDEEYTVSHKLGDDCQGVPGTVTAGYLHYSKTRMYVFTEESGHYGRRWTQPVARESFAEFMKGSNLEEEYTLKPYFRHARESVTATFQLGEDSSIDHTKGDFQKQYGGALEEGVEDEEWDFS